MDQEYLKYLFNNYLKGFEMLKCGQKNNTHYTFGFNDKQIKEAGLKEVGEHKICFACKTLITSKAKFCPSCGEKL